MIGRVLGVSWYDGSGGFGGRSGSKLSEHVAEFFDPDTTVAESVMAVGLDVR